MPVLTKGSAAAITPHWSKDVLGRTYAAWPFVEYGLFLSLAYAVRQAMSDTVQFSVVFQAVDRMRLLQDIVHHLDSLHENAPGFTDSGARDAWMSDSTLVPIRDVVESIVASEDWVEILVAGTLVFEPLVGYLAKSEFFSGLAAQFGDSATPTILALSLRDADRQVASVQALVRLVAADAIHGERNRAVISSWISAWQPRCEAAARSFLPVFAACGVTSEGCAQALSRAVENQKAAAEGAVAIL